jgi:hypothetical protein
VGRFALQGRSMMGASRGSGSLRRCGWIADVGDTARRRRMRRPGSLAGLAPAPQWLWVESVALVIAVEEAQQVQDTLFKKLWRGFAPSFSAHVRSGERGAPVQFPVCWFWVEGLGLKAVVSHISRKTSEIPGFPVRGSKQRPRVRLSLRKAAWNLPTPSNLTGNPGVWGTRV